MVLGSGTVRALNQVSWLLLIPPPEGEKVQHRTQPVKHARCALIIMAHDVRRCQLEL